MSPVSRWRGGSNAEIVRQRRERSPDGRCDGSSGEELIELFERNQQVLERSDET